MSSTSSSAPRGTSLRAGGACVRCRKGKTKCVYETGRAPCKNCAKGLHECYLPSESMSHGGHGISPARAPQRARESLPHERTASSAPVDRQPQPIALASRHPPALESKADKLTPELLTECERVIAKTLPACLVLHKPSFVQQLKGSLPESTIINALLATAARSSPWMIRRYGQNNGPSVAVEHFAMKAGSQIFHTLDSPSLADIQATCLLVIQEWGSRNAVRAYIYLGQAARMAQMFRIVHHFQSDPDRFLQEESFRRTLWLIYILDCFLTSSPGRYPVLTSLEIKDISLPCEDRNFSFGSPAFVRTLDGKAPSECMDSSKLGEVGEFGHIILATEAWRNVVEMMTTTSLQTFDESMCVRIDAHIEGIRDGLPHHYADKPGQISLHITMGSGYTFAMLHSLLHCASIFNHRRRLLQYVTAENFSVEAWRSSPHHRTQIVDSIFAASHSIVAMLAALGHGQEKDTMSCFPIFMLFAGFSAGSTVAYLALKGLLPPDVNEAAVHLVHDTLTLLKDGSESWPLVLPWQRHLGVMAGRLRKSMERGERALSREDSHGYIHNHIAARPSPSIKDDTLSQPDTTVEAMDYDVLQPPERMLGGLPIPPIDGNGEGPVSRRPLGVTTINGNGSVGITTTPANGTPPPSIPGHTSNGALGSKSPNPPGPESTSSATVDREPVTQREADPATDMTCMELCAAFERQLLELDDLAAFMGGGV